MQSNHKAPLSSALEDYLKTIYLLLHEENVESQDAVSTQALAARLGVKPPSATAMIKKLASLQLVEHVPYQGVCLSGAGEKVALEVLRHHRLVETYLSQVLGLGWHEVHDEAERWEHVLGEGVEEQMAKALGNPERDPHGAPIPSIDGKMPRDAWLRLPQAEPGKTYTVCRVYDESTSLLQHLHELGITPGVHIKVLRAEATEGVLHLKVNNHHQIMGLAPASVVAVMESV
ncbi:MAG: metal-dependent transcriptional regulator [Abditibacteriaceae bacterium]